jgi:hypothetical protein
MSVPGVDIDARLDHLLAHLQIAPPACLAELAERLGGVERIILLQPARRDSLALCGERALDLELPLRVHGGACGRPDGRAATTTTTATAMAMTMALALGD